jgi:putative transcriptional regulator
MAKSRLVYNRIKAELAEQQKSNRWLAKALGKGENTVSRWCSNSHQPSLEQLGEIAKVLNVDVRTLLRPMEDNEVEEEKE